MFRTALRNIAAHKTRLLMTVLAVLLGVAFVSGTLVFSDTIATAFRSVSAKDLADVAVSIEDQMPKEDGSTSIDDKAVSRIGAVPGVDEARPSVSDLTTVADKDGKALGGDWGGEGANYFPGPGGKDFRYPLQEGRGPTNASEVALDAKSAKRAGFEVGDTLRIVVDGPVMKKKLVGIVGTQDPRVGVGGSLVLFDTATAQKLFTAPGYFQQVIVTAKPGTDEAALTSKISELLPEGAEARSGAEMAAEQSRQIAEETKSMSQLLMVFAGIALFVGIFIIANTFTMLVAQRTRELALLRAVGATRGQVTRSVLIEATLLGLIASAAGFVLGIGIAVGLRSVLNAAEAELPDGPLVVSPSAVVASVVVGVVVTVLAAWLPSRRAAKIAPVEAMSTAEQPPSPRGLRMRNAIGATLTALGIAWLVYVSTLHSTDYILMAMAGAGVLMIGCIVLAPALARPLVSVTGAAFRKMFGVCGKLAQENAVRNPRRTAATASALMIGLTLITGLTVAGQSVQHGMDQRAVQDLTADYSVVMNGGGGLTPDMSQRIADTPGVEHAVPLRTAYATAGDEFLGLTGTDTASLPKVTGLSFTSGSLDELGGDRIAISEKTAKATGWKPGHTAELSFNDYEGRGEKQRVTVGAVYRDNQVVPDMFGATGLVDPHMDPVRNDQVLVKAADGKADGLDERIRQALGGNPVVKVRDRESVSKENAQAVNLMLNMVYGLLGMAVIIAVLGVVNTLAMSVFERTREIGMLRAIGLTRGEVRLMVRLESVMIALFGAVLGICLGTFIAWAGGELVGSDLENHSLVVPWDRIGLFLVIAVVVGMLAAVWPARRAAGLSTLSAISTQ